VSQKQVGLLVPWLGLLRGFLLQAAHLLLLLLHLLLLVLLLLLLSLLQLEMVVATVALPLPALAPPLLRWPGELQGRGVLVEPPDVLLLHLLLLLLLVGAVSLLVSVLLVCQGCCQPLAPSWQLGPAPGWAPDQRHAWLCGRLLWLQPAAAAAAVGHAAVKVLPHWRPLLPHRVGC
jgi:hypothetical protein